MGTSGVTVKVNHVGISVVDLSAAQRFWMQGMGAADHGAFGWPVGTAPADESLATPDTAAEVQLLRTDSAFMEIFAFSSPVPRPRDVNSPGVTGLIWAARSPEHRRAQAVAHGGVVSPEAQDVVLCPAGTPLRIVASGGGPEGLVGVELAVAVAEKFVFADVAGPVGLHLSSGASATPAAAVDLGVNHLCLDVDDIGAARLHGTDVAWHHPVTESSGGLAAVCYGTTADGVLVELLESRSDEAFLARCRLMHP